MKQKLPAKHSERLDEEKLEFACNLINRERVGDPTVLAILADALLIMQFGQITAQDMIDYLESQEITA